MRGMDFPMRMSLHYEKRTRSSDRLQLLRWYVNSISMMLKLTIFLNELLCILYHAGPKKSYLKKLFDKGRSIRVSPINTLM